MSADQDSPEWETYKTRVTPLGSVSKKKKPKPVPSAPPRVPKLSFSTKTFDLASDRWLEKAKITPQAKLDLHGMTQKEAHAALLSFVEKASLKKAKLLLVVTGRGKDGLSVLRKNVPRWCEVAPLKAVVSSVRPALIKHGGDGAFYLLLSRPS